MKLLLRASMFRKPGDVNWWIKMAIQGDAEAVGYIAMAYESDPGYFGGLTLDEVLDGLGIKREAAATSVS